MEKLQLNLVVLTPLIEDLGLIPRWKAIIMAFISRKSVKYVREIFVARIAGYPRKLDPRNKCDCAMYKVHDRTRPRKINRKNFEDWPSAKIGPHEIFPIK
jgi:hypothetical protein